jgi:hypothetical protein
MEWAKCFEQIVLRIPRSEERKNAIENNKKLLKTTLDQIVVKEQRINKLKNIKTLSNVTN